MIESEIWKLRQKELKEKGWTYNKNYGMWDSLGGNAEYTEDLKLMNEKEFTFCLTT